MATGPDDDPQHDVLRGLAFVRQGLGMVGEATCWSLSDDETRAALEDVTHLQAVARAAYLRLLAESARRDDPTRPGTRDGAETSAFVSAACRLSTGRVRADLREATALDPDHGDLRGLGARLAAGKVTPEHTGIAVRALDSIPAKIARDRRADIDTVLTDHATRFAPPVTRKLATHLLATIVPDRADHFDAEAHLRRELYVFTDSTGMVIVRGQLEPAGGAAFKGLIDHLSAPHHGPVETEDGQAELTINDQRSPAQRRHDALTEAVRLASGNLDAGVRAGEPPRVVVHTSTDQLAAATGGDGTAFLKPPGSATCEQTGPLTPATLGRLACDAVIDRILLDPNGKVLQMDTLGRLFTGAQRRALAARDGGCAFPGCDRPPSWCDSHHVIYWTDGGPTTLDNGVLLCGPHHTTIHLGDWVIVMKDGVPWFLPPARLDPGRTPIRNTVHDAITAARRAGQQMHLDLPLEHPPDDPDG